MTDTTQLSLPPELTVARADWVSYQSLEEARSDYISTVQDTEWMRLEESLKAYSAVRSGYGKWGDKERILSELGSTTGHGRTTVNLRYKVGAVFPRDKWLDGSQMLWSHYRAAAQAAKLDQPDTYREAHRVLVAAADGNWSSRQIEHYLAKQRRANGEDEPEDDYPTMFLRAAICKMFITQHGKIILAELPEKKIKELHKLGDGAEVIISLSSFVKRKELTDGLQAERELAMRDNGARQTG